VCEGELVSPPLTPPLLSIIAKESERAGVKVWGVVMERDCWVNLFPRFLINF